MSLLTAFLAAISGKKNIEPKIATAVSDDGTGDAIDAGKPSPLRADPTTGALLTSAASGASGGIVEQGDGNATKPWQVQGVNAGVAERLATQTTLAALLARMSPGSTAPTPLVAKTVPTVTAEAVASSTPVTRFVRVQSDFANTKTIYVSGTGVTVANGQQLGPGDVYTYDDVDNANLIFCISADAAQVLRVEVL